MAMPGSSNSTVTVTLVILAWYSSNIGVLLLNKFLLTHTSFKKPVFLTLCHMCACVLVGGIISLSRILPVKPIKSRPQGIKIGILSCIFCFTIVAANASLRFLPVSFNQAVGSTTPLFTAIFAFFLQGVKEESMTYATLIPIAVGIMIASGGEPLFHFIGFMLCMSATAGRAMKSVIQSMLLSDPNDKMDSMCLLFYMASCSVVILVPAVFILEPEAFGLACDMVNAPDGDMFFWAMVINSLLAYLTNLTNFLVTKFTSALTLQVLGNAKGVVCAALSIMIFHNPVTFMGMTGYAITVLGVFMYSESKRQSAKSIKASIQQEDRKEDTEALLSTPKRFGSNAV